MPSTVRSAASCDPASLHRAPPAALPDGVSSLMSEPRRGFPRWPLPVNEMEPKLASDHEALHVRACGDSASWALESDVQMADYLDGQDTGREVLLQDPDISDAALDKGVHPGRREVGASARAARRQELYQRGCREVHGR